ncbi:hypothetical protein AXFE_26740 [Acidithrix ferrooxidans]|uniref:Uncharacterized protein n=1 Tax=Acidithrix ferrooxidans TaxID=1280514 RepID=A0A0D8HF61_9ACTN|nr:hypothetical protein AXFE_26740 [Acidithrix ferrooxidans]
MKTIAALGIFGIFAFLLFAAIGGFRPAWIVLVVVIVFSLLFNIGPNRKRKTK